MMKFSWLAGFLILLIGCNGTLLAGDTPATTAEPSPSKKYGAPRDMTALQFDVAGAAEQALLKEFDPKNRIIFCPPSELKFYQRTIESKFIVSGWIAAWDADHRMIKLPWKTTVDPKTYEVEILTRPELNQESRKTGTVRQD